MVKTLCVLVPEGWTAEQLAFGYTGLTRVVEMAENMSDEEWTVLNIESGIRAVARDMPPEFAFTDSIQLGGQSIQLGRSRDAIYKYPRMRRW